MKFKKEQLQFNGYIINQIRDLRDNLKCHGRAHLEHDILPQFTELCKKVDKLEGVMNFKLNDGPIANHSKRIKDLEEINAQLWENIGKLEIRMDNMVR